MTTVIHRIADCKKIAMRIPSEVVIGLVPTMGALHQGHGALFAEARRRCSVVVASIFVNPIQFDKKCEYDLYPRVLKDDIAFCTALGVDYIFAPPSDEMYPEPQRVFADVEEVSLYLCGQNRPGHFRGVATVVLKLFHIVQPHLAFFGEKDYQQLAIVRRLVRDLNIPLKVVAVPTVRERDGLALSSRNRRLTLRDHSRIRTGEHENGLAPATCQSLSQPAFPSGWILVSTGAFSPTRSPRHFSPGSLWDYGPLYAPRART